VRAVVSPGEESGTNCGGAPGLGELLGPVDGLPSGAGP